MMEISIHKENTVTLFIPMQIKKRGGAAMVILPQSYEPLKPKENHDSKLIKALGKAYKWQKMLEKDGLTIKSIAQKESVTPSYVGRMLRLNFLSPSIVTSILEGTQPKTLKLQDLIGKSLNPLWEVQMEMI